MDFFRQTDGAYLGQLSFEPDFVPAIQWARFQELKTHNPQALLRALFKVEPIWHPYQGEPYVGGITVSAYEAGKPPRTYEFPVSYFRTTAARLSDHFVKKNLLRESELFYYVVTAVRTRPESSRQDSSPHENSTTSCQGLPKLRDDCIDSYLKGSEAREEIDLQDFPLFLLQDLLEEIERLSLEAGPNERGGVLLGYLCRDTKEKQIFGVVTAQFNTSHCIENPSSFTFTPRAWKSVEDLIRLRDKGEILLGWWHCHPEHKPSPNGPTNCLTFFSDKDCHLHRTVFYPAWCIGLLITRLPGRAVHCACYGWRYGEICRRGFYVLR